jgi:hypothetical protein
MNAIWHPTELTNELFKHFRRLPNDLKFIFLPILGTEITIQVHGFGFFDFSELFEYYKCYRVEHITMIELGVFSEDRSRFQWIAVARRNVNMVMTQTTLDTLLETPMLRHLFFSDSETFHAGYDSEHWFISINTTLTYSRRDEAEWTLSLYCSRLGRFPIFTMSTEEFMTFMTYNNGTYHRWDETESAWYIPDPNE